MCQLARLLSIRINTSTLPWYSKLCWDTHAAALQHWACSVMATQLGTDFAIGDQSIMYCKSTSIASEISRSTKILFFLAFLDSAVILFKLAIVHKVVRTACHHTQLLFNSCFFCWTEWAHISIFTKWHGTETPPFLCPLLRFLFKCIVVSGTSLLSACSSCGGIITC